MKAADREVHFDRRTLQRLTNLAAAENMTIGRLVERLAIEALRQRAASKPAAKPARRPADRFLDAGARD